MKIHLLLLAPLLWLSGCASNMVQGYDINELRNRMGDRTLVIRMAPDEVLPIEVDSSSQEDYADDIVNSGITKTQFDSLIRSSMCKGVDFGLPKKVRWEKSFPGKIDSFVYPDSSYRKRKTVFYGDTTNSKPGELLLLRSSTYLFTSNEYQPGYSTMGTTLGSMTYVSSSYVKYIRATFFYSIYDPQTRTHLMTGIASDHSNSLSVPVSVVTKSDWTKSARKSVDRLVDDLIEIYQ